MEQLAADIMLVVMIGLCGVGIATFKFPIVQQVQNKIQGHMPGKKKQ